MSSKLSQFMAGKVNRQQKFTSSGTFTPNSIAVANGNFYAEILSVGGGAGGQHQSLASTTSQGGAGGAVNKYIKKIKDTTLTVTVGAGGAGATVAGNGSAGGNTSIIGASAFTTLNGGIDSAVTSLALTAAANVDNEDIIIIGSEHILVQSGAGTVTLTVIRGYNGTTAASHSNGDSIYYMYAYAKGGSALVSGNGNGGGYVTAGGAGSPTFSGNYDATSGNYSGEVAGLGLYGYGAGGSGTIGSFIILQSTGTIVGGVSTGVNAASVASDTLPAGTGGFGNNASLYGYGGVGGLVLISWFE